MRNLPIPPLVPPAPISRSVVRACRPSLIDLRFKGDAWVVSRECRADVCLGDFPMGHVAVSPLDVPSLNRALLQVRFGQARRNYVRRLRRVGA